jgi:type IV pilus assembly protein PilB
VASSLNLILAQRLARRVCRDCREAYEADEDTLIPYGHVPEGLGRLTLYLGKGCQTCNFTGLKGRIAVYEVMPITQEIRDLILKNADTAEVRRVAQSQGMKSLRQNALAKVIEGTTTLDEVVRVTLA